MTNRIDINWMCEEDDPPEPSQMVQWLDKALELCQQTNVEVSVAIVNVEEITKINADFRGKPKATNVLSFPANNEQDDNDFAITFPEDLALSLEPDLKTNPIFLGDIICCPSVIKKEAEQYGVPLTMRWAHMLVHGLLHLLGMDHIDTKEQQQMEDKETIILNQLGFDNPYISE